MSKPTSAQAMTATTATQRYTAAWRWHFFAGIVVIPFLLIVSVTGLIMLYYTAVQTPVGEPLRIHPDAGPRSAPSLQLATAQEALPDATVAVFIPASSPDRPVQFDLKHGEKIYAIDVNPYNNEVLRVVDKDSTLYALAYRIHGTLLLGEIGDAVMEVVAGLALLMLATGIYMWFQRRAAAPAPANGLRNGWRRWHQNVGLYASLLLCFFLLTGLAWTDVWGGKLVQPWSSFPAQKWGPVPLAEESHGAMNHSDHKAVPWGLEQTPLPLSGASHSGAAVDLDTVDRIARELGFGPRFRINLPQDANGVYTISRTTMSGELENPADERTVHIDRHSGEVVAEVGFADYSLLAKSMAVGVAVHQGSLGWWSIALDMLACMTVIFLCISGTLMWWLRRPARAGWLPVPPRLASLPLRSGLAQPGLTVLLFAMGIAFPLLGVAILGGLLLYALVSRFTGAAR